ncbi:hypothetical protein IAR50_000542 [Cryptococcus sp. DSM 104548]
MASSSATPVPYIPSGVHFHSSLPSHLATELAFLQTFIRRAVAQHRTQLFLQRMEGTLRMGKVLLVYLKGCGEKREGDAEDKWKHRGMCLVRKMVRSLYDAQFITSQIVDLHHFLPLQTAALSIYARLFTVTLNLAGALGMDLEGLVSSAGSRKRVKEKLTRRDSPANMLAGSVGGNANTAKPEGRTLDFEIGEKIERSSIPQPAVKASQQSAVLRRQELTTSPKHSPAPITRHNQSQTPANEPQSIRSVSPISNPESPGSLHPESDTALVPIEVDRNELPSGSLLEPKKKKKKVGDGLLASGVAVSQKKQRLATLGNEPSVTPSLPVSTSTSKPLASTLEVPKKKKKRVDDEGITSDKTKVKKKKKKDAMDDIFGF